MESPSPAARAPYEVCADGEVDEAREQYVDVARAEHHSRRVAERARTNVQIIHVLSRQKEREQNERGVRFDICVIATNLIFSVSSFLNLPVSKLRSSSAGIRLITAP